MDRLIEKIIAMKNPTVAGLDPKLDYVPEYLKQAAFSQHGETLEGAAEAILAFNKGLIDALCDIVPAVKPQAAYYEMYGYPGVKALYETIQYAKEKGMYVITDGKRNDIGSTMEAYATAHLGTVAVGGKEIEPFGGDALTVNGYLGTDGIKPLQAVCKERNKSLFVLVKTSNPSSGELQDRLIDGKPVYIRMAELCTEWGKSMVGQYGYSQIGAVVGATYPEQLKELRQQFPQLFFLVPGYGAQGGGAAGLVGAFDKRGIGAVVNSSRAIMCAYQKEGCAETDYAQAARREALRMKEDITSYLPDMA